MEGDLLEEILSLIVTGSAKRGMSRPLRLRVEYAEPLDNIEVPFSLVRHASSEKGKPIKTNSAPDNATEAILTLLALIGQRRTGQELAMGIEERWPHQWADTSIAAAASNLHKAGRLTNKPRDPGDGYGKGYGLPEWDQVEGQAE